MIEPDDMYPSDGSFFFAKEPVEQELARKKEKAHTLEALPILEELLAQLDKDIAFYGSVDSIPAEAKADPTKFLIVHNSNQLVRDRLREKKEYVEGLLQSHAPSR